MERANQTFRRIEPPWQAIKEWIPVQEPQLDWFNRPRNDREEYDQSTVCWRTTLALLAFPGLPEKITECFLSATALRQAQALRRRRSNAEAAKATNKPVDGSGTAETVPLTPTPSKRALLPVPFSTMATPK